MKISVPYGLPNHKMALASIKQYVSLLTMNKQLVINLYVNKTSAVPYHTEYVGIGKHPERDKGISAEEHSEYVADWMVMHPNGKVEFIWAE